MKALLITLAFIFFFGAALMPIVGLWLYNEGPAWLTIEGVELNLVREGSHYVWKEVSYRNGWPLAISCGGFAVLLLGWGIAFHCATETRSKK